MKNLTVALLVQLAILVIMLPGNILCIKKIVECDWEAPYKSEFIYTVSFLTGAGCVVGFFDIEDK